MKLSIVLVAITTFLFLVTFPTTTVGKNMRFWPNKPTKGWPYPSRISRNTVHRLNYVQDSKVWKCTYSNGSSPAISISPSSPSSPSPPTSPKTSPPPPPTLSPPPPTPSPPPPTPKTSPPPSPPPPTPKTSPPLPTPSPPPPTPSPPPPTPKTSPPPPTPSPPHPTPSPPPPTPKTSPSPPKHSLPPPQTTPSPSPPKEDESSSPPSEPSKPTPPKEPNNHHHHDENPWEHVGTCMRNMGRVRMCRGEMEMSFYTRMFRVSDYCCNLVVNMKNECDDVVWGFFTDPFFVPLVRCTCHVNLLA
ncbi:unnamed protein product [Cochlearia groenlandica]